MTCFTVHREHELPPVRRAMTLLLLLAASLIWALAFAPAADAQPGDYTLTLAINDPLMPEFEHTFEFDGVTVTATHEAPASIEVSAGATLDGLYVPTTVSLSSAGCDSPFIDATTSEIVGSMPQTDVTCTFTVVRDSGVEIVTNISGDPDAEAVYWISGSNTFVDLTLVDGERTFVGLPPNDPLSVSQLPKDNLFLASVECTDDAGGSTVPGFNRDVDLNLAPGEVAVCTFTNIVVGTADLTVVFESEDPAAKLVLGDPLRGTTITLNPGDSFARTTHPTQAVVYPTESFTSPVGYPLQASCDGDQGTLTIGEDGLSGLAPMGADVTCTFSTALASEPTITLVTDVSGELNPTFEYQLVGESFSEQVTQGRGDSTTISVPADTTISLRSVANGNWIPAMWCTGVVGAVVYPGNAGADAEITLERGQDVTCRYSHTLDETGRVFWVVNAPDHPDARFEFDGVVIPFRTIEVPHGSAQLVNDRFGLETWVHPDNISFDVLCSGTAATPTVRDRDYEVSVYWGQVNPGTVLVCVLEATNVLPARVTFAVEAADPAAKVAIDDPYEGRTLVATPTSFPSGLIVGATPWYSMGRPTGYDAYPGECTGPGTVTFADFGGGAIPTFSKILTGDLVPGTNVTCTLILRPTPSGDLYPTVTCLAGNGRIDMNVVNTDSVAHTYSVKIGALSPRVRTVEAADWWRSPVTGRPDGPIPVQVLRDGDVIYDSELVVDCDDNDPTVSSPEIQLLGACRDGNGFAAWQFANPTNARRSYVIEFEGLPNRSTSAAPFGASVRGVSGRPDGNYEITIRADGVIVEEGTVVVNCD